MRGGATVRALHRNPNVHTLPALARHARWHFRRFTRGFPYEQTISRSRIVAHDHRCGVSALVNNQGVYDYDNMRLLQRVLIKGIFFDVGANIGSYTLLVSEQPGVEVHAFEPHPETYRRLVENVQLNGRANVTTHNVALSDRDGWLSFTDAPGSSTNTVTDDGPLQVECVRADALGLQPDVVKIDVEGYERFVLNGFGRLLDTVKVLLIETADDVEGLEGPYAYNDANQRFHKRLGNLDRIFVAPSFRVELERRGFVFS